MILRSPFFSILIAQFIFFASCQTNGDTSSQHSKNQGDAIAENIESLPSKDTNSLEELVAIYDSPDRVLWQKPKLVISKMGDLRDKTVADIGAGSGFFSRRLAQHAKKVIAIEIDERFIEFMDSIKLVELSEKYQKRFETRLATPEDAKLKPAEADLVLMVNTYIYIKNRVPYLKKLMNGIAPGGKIFIVDFKRKRIPIANPPAKLRIPLYQVEAELEEAGYKNIVSDDRSLDYQYIVMAERK